MKPNALFCISSLGLGHATRSLPVIKAYVESHAVHIISHGQALEFLKRELSGMDGVSVVYHELFDYPPIERGSGLAYGFYLIVDLLTTVFIIRKEHAFVAKLAEQIQSEFIFSDGRYGSYVNSIPSFILSHQISFSIPKGFGPLKKIAEWFNYLSFKKFDYVFIPDFEPLEYSLAGALSHHKMLKKIKHSYIGILSSLEKSTAVEDIDFLFSVSGYIIDQRNSFISKLQAIAKELPGERMFALGGTSGSERQDLFNRAKRIVSRCGYTTVMDILELEKVGFLEATPGQTEQMYLADYLKKTNYSNFVVGSTADLVNLYTKTAIIPAGQKVPWKTQRSVQMLADQIAKEISASRQQAFFSIIIPAHNEEKCLAKTLAAVKNLSYPKNSFEVIVIENGSTDSTLAVAQSFEGSNLRVLVSERGVSRAKNKGLNAISPESDWAIILDADTIVDGNFLKELDVHFKENKKKNISIATTTVLPYVGEDRNPSLYARVWFAFYNIGHALTKTSFSIQIVNVKHGVRFNESKTFAEDLALIKKLRTFGSFSYIRTRSVHTSVRRFVEIGWFRLFFKWNWQALVLAKRGGEAKPYDVIR